MARKMSSNERARKPNLCHPAQHSPSFGASLSAKAMNANTHACGHGALGFLLVVVYKHLQFSHLCHTSYT